MTSVEPGPVPPPHVASRWVRDIDRAGESLAGRLRGRATADRAMYALSEAGTHSSVWHGINLFDAVVGTVADRPHQRRQALRRSGIQIVEQAIVNGPVKMVFRRSRPGVITDHPHSLRAPRTSSFPSGHASAGFCAATLLAADLGHPVIWYGLATSVAWSRVHVGVHHPSDIVGGAMVGVTLAKLATRIWPPPSARRR